MTPSPTEERDAHNCVKVPRDAADPYNGKVLSYYKPDFWRQAAIGKSFLAKAQAIGTGYYDLPASVDAVLAKATEFRTTFRLEPSHAPAFLYFSPFWKTPDSAPLTQKYEMANGPWNEVEGDGRVPSSSANWVNPSLFGWIMAVTAAHGNIPADQDFIDDFFDIRLPALIDGHIASQMMEMMTKDGTLARAYWNANGIAPIADELKTAFEPRIVKPIARTTVAALDFAKTFTATKCKVSAHSCTTYALAREDQIAAKNSAARERNASKFEEAIHRDRDQYEKVAKERSYQREVYASGNKGFEQAQAGRWRSAGQSLETARVMSSADDTVRIDQSFQLTVKANLAKALVEAGQCQDAEPYLRETISYWSYARQILETGCYEVARGILHTFGK